MAQIQSSTPLIKAALIKDLRVGIIFKNDDIVAEYHFIRDPRDPPDELNGIICVMCTSTANDPLRLSGITRSVKEFTGFVERPVIYTSNAAPYQRIDVKLYPKDWYPCFQNNKEDGISQIKEMMPALKELSNTIEEKDAKEKLEAEIRHRNLALDTTSSSRYIRSDFQRPLVMPPNLTDRDISEMLAKGFFNRRLPNF